MQGEEGGLELLRNVKGKLGQVKMKGFCEGVEL